MSMAFSTLLLALFLAFFTTGGVLIIAGFIGRPVATAPVCARCGHGVAVRPSAEGPLGRPLGACPECGASLDGEDGVRHFRRLRVTKRIAAGIGLCILAFGVPIASRILLVSTVGLSGVGPTSSVQEIADIIASRNGSEYFAFEEIARRAQTSNLSDAEFRTILDGMRRREATLQSGRFIQPTEAQVLLSALARGLVDADELMSLIAQGLPEPRLELPSTIRGPHSRTQMGGERQNLGAFDRDLLLEAIAVDGTPIPLTDSNGAPYTTPSLGTFVAYGFQQPPGDYRLTVTFREEFQSSSPTLARTGNQPPPLSRRVVIEQPLRIVAGDAPTWIELASPPDRRAAVLAACEVRAVAIDPDAGGSACTVRTDYTIRPVPELAIAFEVIVLLGDREIRTATHVVRQTGGTTFTWPMRGYEEATIPLPRESLPSTVTVVLRPRPSAAESLVGISAIWGETITFERVPVHSTAVPVAKGEETR